MKILLILALLLIGFIFSLHADNTQGRIHWWDGYQWVGSDDEYVTVILYYDAAHGGGIFDDADLTTNNSVYFCDFEDPNNNWEYCDRVVVIYRSEPHWSNYDGDVTIDIWWFQPS